MSIQQIIDSREEKFDERFNKGYKDPLNHSVAEIVRDEHKKFQAETIRLVLEAVKDEAEQYEQFIMNILNGIDVADYQMQKEGGGTKAIRYALSTRIKPSALLTQELRNQHEQTK